MANYVCIKRCFYRDTLWEKGQPLASAEGEKVPKHFTKVQGTGSKVASPVVDRGGAPPLPEARTLKEIQDQQEAERLDSLPTGHPDKPVVNPPVVNPPVVNAPEMTGESLPEQDFLG